MSLARHSNAVAFYFIFILGMALGTGGCTPSAQQPRGANDPTSTLSPLPPTAIPTLPPAASPTLLPLTEEQLLGMWLVGGFDYLTFHQDHTYTSIYYPGGEVDEQGTWKITEDNHLVLSGRGERSYQIETKADTLLVAQYPQEVEFLFRKVDVRGTPLPLVIPESAVPFPLFDPMAVESIYITDNWTGLSILAPIQARFALERGKGAFQGEAHFSVAGYTEALTGTSPITLPSEAGQAFLGELATVPVLADEYRPQIIWTDDYPELKIRLLAGDKTITFFSESQGAAHAPWSVTVGAATYVAYSETIMAALEGLDPYLARDMQERLMEQAENRQP